MMIATATFHKRRNDLVLVDHHAEQVIGHLSADCQIQCVALLDLIAKLHDGKQCFDVNATPVQTDAAERLRFSDRDADAKLGCPDDRVNPPGPDPRIAMYLGMGKTRAFGLRETIRTGPRSSTSQSLPHSRDRSRPSSPCHRGRC